jgi:RNA polymerase sigma factor (sigma-70 family)
MNKILIVDDDAPITDGLTELFRLNDFEATGTYDRRTAEAAMADECFAVVLADLRLHTEADGLALLDAIRELNPEARVVTLTGHATPEAEQQVRARGVSTVLRKPMAFEEILQAIELLLEERLDDSSGDVEALYEETRRILHSIPIRRYGFSAEESDELVQEAWLLFLEKRRGIRKARPWLTGTMANLCKQEIERHRKTRERTRDLETLPIEPSATRGMPSADVLAVREILGRADDRTRQLCTLIGMEGLSYEEAARELDMPIGSVGPLYIRAKKRLRRDLEGSDA